MTQQALEGLAFVVQYRAKRDGIEWRPMAAFDVLGPAEWYYGMQKTGENWPFEYRLIRLADGELADQVQKP